MGRGNEVRWWFGANFAEAGKSVAGVSCLRGWENVSVHSCAFLLDILSFQAFFPRRRTQSAGALLPCKTSLLVRVHFFDYSKPYFHLDWFLHETYF